MPVILIIAGVDAMDPDPSSMPSTIWAVRSTNMITSLRFHSIFWNGIRERETHP
uniref:Uncharacterized protein n=1 Tax=Anguilla anguilla TaxID=7936 RepID=A0A0E9Q393_ANGAN